MTVGIVVVAYNRPRALARLLNSIKRASYEGIDNAPLIISIDGGGDPEVAAVAQQFQWQYGEKDVYTHKTNLGLKTHVLSAGDRTTDYDGIIMLEDDLVVSPLFYEYGKGALAAYQNDETIAGVSLYSYRYLDVNGLFFWPSVGNGNTFLVRFPSSCGQAWTTQQWRAFSRWLASGRDSDCPDLDAKFPMKVASWPSSSWKKSFARYLIDTDGYIIYPATSLTTNMGDAGHHWQYDTGIFQVPLQVAPTEYRFTVPSQAISYDQFFELESRSLAILGYSGELSDGVEFDLYGQKPPAMIGDKLALSSKRFKSPIRSFGMELLPHELNIIYEVKGRDFNLGEWSDIDCGSQPPRVDLIKHHTASLSGSDLTKLLVRKLLRKIRARTWQ